MTKDAWGILMDATILATGEIAHQKNVYAQLVANADEHVVVTKRVFKSHMAEVKAEWSAAVEAKMNKAWLRELMNAQAHTIALEILKEMELI